jgi:hypothetical protein
MPAAIILGDAACVYKDAALAFQRFSFDAVAATNNIGLDWEGHIDHWCTLHPLAAANPDPWPGIAEMRRRRKLAGRNDPTTWSFKMAPGVDYVMDDWLGSSGLFAFRCLRSIGFDSIIFAGVPLTSEEAHYNDAREWRQASAYHKGWLKHVDEIAPYARSMSGWTRELIGAP